MNRSLLLLLPLTLALGCAGARPDNTPLTGAARTSGAVTQTETQTETAAATPEVPPVPDAQIDMRAVARGNVVRFQIRNNAVANLYVGPENFALISPGTQRPLLATDDQVVRRVISTTINPGEYAAGELAFLGQQSIVGHRLIYNSNQTQPNMWSVNITAAAATPESRRTGAGRR